MSKRKTLAIVSAVAAFAAVSASAASLGAMTGTGLGAATLVVSPCDSDGMAVAYVTSYSTANSRYNVTAINLTGVDSNCAAKVANLTLLDSTGAVIGTTAVPSLAVVSGAATITVPGVSAQAITNLSLVISG